MMQSILPISIFILTTCLLEPVAPIPLKKHKFNFEHLRPLLGSDYDLFNQLDGELKLAFVKEMSRASGPEEQHRVYQHWMDIMKRHVPGHSPGSVEQLHETWSADDRMTNDSYSPKSLFLSHDFNNDGFLAGPEIHSLYYSQLDRMYPDHEDYEEKLRLREDIRMYANYLNLMDKDRDGKISLQEFLNYHPQHDEDYDWMDEDDLPDMNHLGDDKVLVEAVQKDLELHPNDTISEELMHRIAGKPAIPEKAASSGGYQFPHHEEHQNSGSKHDVPHPVPAAHDPPHGAPPIPAHDAPHAVPLPPTRDAPHPNTPPPNFPPQGHANAVPQQHA